jgi:uncharacterized YccA/Bax inhibitor family protein
MNFRTSNPIFNSYFFGDKYFVSNKMTLSGIIIKTLFSLFLVSVSVWYVWRIKDDGQEVIWYLYGGMIIAVILSVLTSYRQNLAFITVPLYAIAKGCFLGAITAFGSSRYNNLPLKAVFYTLISFSVMLILYKIKLIKVSRKLRSIIYGAIASIFTIYFLSFILRFFGIKFSIVYGSSWISILFTIVVVSVASFSLLLDFNYMDRYLNKAPKRKEWIATWGLLVTIIWMYFEIFRLLKKITNKL